MIRFTLNFIIVLIIIANWSCQIAPNKKTEAPNKVLTVGAMKEAMWKGELFPKIALDTITNRKGLYGIGPQSYMRGEILILDGKPYLADIDKNDSLQVREHSGLDAPFFVYTNVTSWDTLAIPKGVKSIRAIDSFLSKTNRDSLPFAFKLKGSINSADIHIQNLPEGTKVSSPKEAHIGQRQFHLKNYDVEIIGFYSKLHQGIFTHHDTYTHMHLITDDLKYMGHLDHIDIGEMELLLPSDRQ